MRELGLLLMLAAGCASGPKYKIDESVLAQIPTSEKGAVMQAQQEQNIAKDEQRKADADLSQVDRELDIAENEFKSSKLAVDSAELSKKNAEATGDMNRKSQAEHELKVAEMGKKAGDAKVDWLSKRKKWIKAERDAAEEHVLATDAKYELEKAKLAQMKGIKPSDDFNVMNFEVESLEKMKKYSEAKLDADKMKADVDNLERKYQALNNEWNALRGQAGR
jgi:hypothetical protein